MALLATTCTNGVTSGRLPETLLERQSPRPDYHACTVTLSRRLGPNSGEGDVTAPCSASAMYRSHTGSKSCRTKPLAVPLLVRIALDPTSYGLRMRFNRYAGPNPTAP